MVLCDLLIENDKIILLHYHHRILWHNYLVCFQAWIIERMGKFHRILDPGLNFLLPIVDRVKYVNSLKEIAIDIGQQSAITKGYDSFQAAVQMANDLG